MFSGQTWLPQLQGFQKRPWRSLLIDPLRRKPEAHRFKNMTPWLPHYLRFNHPRWYRISSINSMTLWSVNQQLLYQPRPIVNKRCRIIDFSITMQQVWPARSWWSFCGRPIDLTIFTISTSLRFHSGFQIATEFQALRRWCKERQTTPYPSNKSTEPFYLRRLPNEEKTNQGNTSQCSWDAPKSIWYSFQSFAGYNKLCTAVSGHIQPQWWRMFWILDVKWENWARLSFP